MDRARLGAAALLALLLGCGGEENEAGLVGAWGAERGDGCAVLFRYDDDGACAWGVACELVGGDIGVERHEGTCEVNGDALTGSWHRSTCEAVRSLSARAYVQGDRLVVDGADGRIIFERLESGGDGSAVIRYGCWDGDTLVFSELRPL